MRGKGGKGALPKVVLDYVYLLYATFFLVELSLFLTMHMLPLLLLPNLTLRIIFPDPTIRIITRTTCVTHTHAEPGAAFGP